MNNDASPRLVPGRWVAVDYGTKRIGLAICDPGGRIASPAATLPGSNDVRRDAQRVLDWAVAEDAVGIVVGLPLSMDGTESAQTKLTKAFAAHVRAMGQLPVELVDERLTTFQADETLRAADLRASKRRRMRDAVAAQIILQSFLDARRSENPPR